ncbi:MAG: hypothetical protein ACRDYX_16760 [Egibacteraceae bacterium]
MTAGRATAAFIALGQEHDAVLVVLGVDERNEVRFASRSFPVRWWDPGPG